MRRKDHDSPHYKVILSTTVRFKHVTESPSRTHFPKRYLSQPIMHGYSYIVKFRGCTNARE